MEERSHEHSSKSTYISKFRELGMLFTIIIISLLVQMRNSNFLTLENINDMLTNTAILSILAVGMMLVIITRGIDLSIGATLALSGMISALTVATYQNLNPILTILLGMGIGTVCGSIVGLLVSKGAVLPIIASLGMMNVYRGLTFIISGGKWVSSYQMTEQFKGIATGRILGINTLIFIAIIIYVISFYFINYTRTGRQIYAVGSNRNQPK